jgi:hypothetical protein
LNQENNLKKQREFRKSIRVGTKVKYNKMKKAITIFCVILFAVSVLTSCGGSIENNSWSGTDIIAGVGFSYKLETKSDNTYKLTGDAGGISVNETGSYKKNSDTEIELLTGDFAGYKFIKEGSSIKIYMDDGNYFMSLH